MRLFAVVEEAFGATHLAFPPRQNRSYLRLLELGFSVWVLENLCFVWELG